MFAKSMFPQKFGAISETTAKAWLGGKLPSSWRLAVVVTYLGQCLLRFGCTGERAKGGGGDAVKKLNQKRRSTYLYKRIASIVNKKKKRRQS